MKPESISEKLMFNTVRLETELGMGTGFFYNFKVGENIYPTIITNKHVVNHKQDENVRFHLHLRDENGRIKQQCWRSNECTLVFSFDKRLVLHIC